MYKTPKFFFFSVFLSICSCLLGTSETSIAQCSSANKDTLTVMFYNLLNYPDGRNDCGGNLQIPTRTDSLKKILQYIKPDALMVCELQNSGGADRILDSALNVNGITYYAKATFVANQSGGTWIK